ncbi:hypothetical protein NDU88_008021 [Pleurodeles waltl]|uniref:Uncharacterized protein n=1 Tax=Pleurodeles waltl TaxID=8319 RepID=A0AAV7PRP4_PLEWA|nr:hypothetical protein NDU88_008021 [Pleurodeles waltl]
MACASGERAPAFTSEELEKLVDGVLPQYMLLYGPPDQQASQCITEPEHSQSPPPMKHQKLASARRERGKTPATQAAHRGTGGSVDSAVTPPKVGKGQKKGAKSGRSSTAEKTAIIPAVQKAPASPLVAVQEDPASHGPAAQEGPASHSPAVQEDPASRSPAAQEDPASHSPASQEDPASHSPAGQ